MNIFDIMGPIMVGPSSSHTAGAARMGYVARKLLGFQPARADIALHGSFAATGAGHGTDKAIVAGLLGMAPDDPGIPRSFQRAREMGMEVSIPCVELRDAHSNTAALTLTGTRGRTVAVNASSLGGGLSVMVIECDQAIDAMGAVGRAALLPAGDRRGRARRHPHRVENRQGTVILNRRARCQLTAGPFFGIMHYITFQCKLTAASGPASRR